MSIGKYMGQESWTMDELDLVEKVYCWMICGLARLKIEKYNEWCVGWGRWKCWKVETRQNNGWNEMVSGKGKHWMIRIHWIGKGQWMKWKLGRKGLKKIGSDPLIKMWM